MFVLGSDRHYFALDVLDYYERDAGFRPDKNRLHVSIQVQNGERSSVITDPLLSTYELSTLGNWFGLVASGISLSPVVFLETGLVIKATIDQQAEHFKIEVTMTSLAAPVWTTKPMMHPPTANQMAHTPFDMVFELTYSQMLEAARELQELHFDFPLNSCR